jgi:4-methylaminobutanoate oxidase (formaldehyde-forming)
LSPGAVGEAAVVVVGGGIWGCAIAQTLARAGQRDIVVLERRQLACGNTPQAAGLVGQLRSTELMARAIRGVVRRLESWARDEGEECGFRPVGSLKLALTEERVRELEEQVRRARAWGVDVELVPPAVARAAVPFLEPRGVRAVASIAGDGYVEPYTFAMAIARSARRLGVTFETDRPVTAVRVERGAVRGVETPAGPVKAPTVIVAAGPWVERVGAAVGLRFDTIPLRHQHWTTAPLEAAPREFPVVRVPDASAYLRPEVGGVLLGGFEPRPKAFSMLDLPASFEIEHTAKDLGVLEELGAGLTEVFPALGRAPVLKGCAGLPTFTPDGNYLVGAVPAPRGLYVAAGCNAIGIAGALVIGEWVTELVLDGRTRTDTSTHALDRFGSRYGNRRVLQEACETIYGHFYSLDKGAF